MHYKEMQSLGWLEGGRNKTLAPLSVPAPTVSSWEGLDRACCLEEDPLGWPLLMVPTESFEVVRKKITKARNKWIQVFPLLIASWDCSGLDLEGRPTQPGSSYLLQPSPQSEARARS
jgi:hypothetical protein